MSPINRFLGAEALFVALALFAGADTAHAESNFAVSTTTIVFPVTTLGDFSYETVTITNSGVEAERLLGVTATGGDFAPTLSGTCIQEYLYVLPAGSSCTVEWVYNPIRMGRQRGEAALYFESSTILTIDLIGRASHH